MTAYALLALAYTKAEGQVTPHQAPKLALDSEPHLAQFVANVLALRPGPVDGIVVESRDDVPVTVVDRLAGDAPVVHDHIECRCTGRNGDRPAQARQERAGMGGEVFGQIGQSRVMGSGQKQRVAAVDRVEYPETPRPRSVSRTLAEGISPRMILQKMQCESCG